MLIFAIMFLNLRLILPDIIIRAHYCKNMNLSYLNKTSVQNKLNNLRALVTNAVNILCVSEIE